MAGECRGELFYIEISKRMSKRNQSDDVSEKLERLANGIEKKNLRRQIPAVTARLVAEKKHMSH